MPEYKFTCPRCSQHLQYDAAYAGREIECPTCRSGIVLPPVIPTEVSTQPSPDELARPERGPGTRAGRIELAPVSNSRRSGTQEAASFGLSTEPTEAELRAFVGQNADYYIGKWSLALANERQSGYARCNWTAFCMPGFWLAYRKLYAAAALVMGLGFLIWIGSTLLPKNAFVSSSSLGLLLIPMTVAVGNSANQLYLAKARKAIASIRARKLSRQEHLAAVAKAGGTSLGAGVVLPLVFLVATFGVAVFFQSVGLGSPYGKRLSFNSAQLYYMPPVTEDQARKLGNYLVEAQYFQGTPATVQLDRAGETMLVRLVVKEDAARDPKYLEVFRIFRRKLSKEVFDGKPVEVHLCDQHLQTLQSIPDGE